MDADGFVHLSNTRGVRVESINERGLADIRFLFDKLGIKACIYRRKSRRVWALQISRKENVMKYRELVGFSLPHKIHALDSICGLYK
jgi:hypothetical protein